MAKVAHVQTLSCGILSVRLHPQLTNQNEPNQTSTWGFCCCSCFSCCCCCSPHYRLTTDIRKYLWSELVRTWPNFEGWFVRPSVRVGKMSWGQLLSWQHLSLQQYQYNGISQLILGRFWPNLDVYCFRPYIFWTPNFLTPNFVWPQFLSDLKLFWTRNFSNKNVWPKKLLTKLLLDPNFV